MKYEVDIYTTTDTHLTQTVEAESKDEAKMIVVGLMQKHGVYGEIKYIREVE